MDRIVELRRQGRLEEALAELDFLLLGQTGPALTLERAHLLGRLKRQAEAVSLLEGLAPRDRGDYGEAMLAGLLEQLGRAEESESLFEHLAAKPRLAPSVVRRVGQYLQARDPERAALWAQRHQSPEAASQQAQSLVKSGHVPEALEVLQRACDRYPGHHGLVCEWALLSLADQPPEVVGEQLETLLSLQEHRDNLKLRERLVQALRETRQWEKAHQEVLECLRQGGNRHYLRALLAYILRDMGRIDEALDLMQELLLEDPADNHVAGAYFKTCREHDRKERASAFVATQAAKDPRKRRWWGAFKKAFRP